MVAWHKKMKTGLDLEYAKSILRYDRGTGNFYRKVDIRGGRGNLKAGTIAGCPDRLGYLTIVIRKRWWLAHRLAWAFEYGELPKGHIDHIDRNPSNNRIENLRVVTPRENAQNKARNPELVGLTYSKRDGQWVAQAKINGKNTYLGSSKDRKKAKAIYDAFYLASIKGL